MAEKTAVVARAMTIREFCEAYRISAPTYYKLQRSGNGPRVVKICSRTIITVEAANEWARGLEQPAAAGEGGNQKNTAA